MLGRAVSAVSGQHREPLDLIDLADGVRSGIMRMPGVTDDTLSLDITPSSQPAYGDPTLLRQVLFNLITDALHRGVQDMLTLRLGATSDVIYGSLEPIASVPPSSAAAPGLDVVRRLLEAAGGRLQLEPEASRVAFTVPSVLPPLVICLDDDPDASRLYGVYLSARGYRVHGVTTGDELRYALSKETPHAIVLDVLMPQEDGWAILEELQGEPETAAIPVIICSVLQQPDLALAMGAKAVLTKPVTSDALCQALDDALA